MELSHPKTKGTISEQFIIAHIMSLGFDVSVPVGDNLRYDLIVDDGKKLYRVQSRTGRSHNGCIVSGLSSSRLNTKSMYKKFFTEIDIEFFALYHEGSVYIVPIHEANRTEITLRVEPPKNGQTKGVRWAKDYLLSVNSFK
jgi:hypothetical protein